MVSLTAAVPCGISGWLWWKLRAIAQRCETAEQQIAEARMANESLSERMTSADDRIVTLEALRQARADWAKEATSVQLNPRGQILRLYHGGESLAGIASALKLSRGEVLLTIRVHELGQRKQETEAKIARNAHRQ